MSKLKYVILLLLSACFLINSGAQGSIVNYVDWNSDSTKIAAGYSSGKTIEIIDVATGSVSQTYSLEIIMGLAWHPTDSDLLAVGTADGSNIGRVHIIDTSGIRQTVTLMASEQVDALTWNSDGSELAAAVYSNMTVNEVRGIYIWETTNWELVDFFDYRAISVNAIAWQPNGHYIATGMQNLQNTNVIIWDRNQGAASYVLNGHSDFINDVDWSPDGQYLASASSADDRTIRIWNGENGQEILAIPNSGGFDIDWSPDGTRIANANLTNKVSIWDVVTGQLTNTVNLTNDAVSVAWNHNGASLAIGDSGGNAKLIQLPIAHAGTDQTVGTLNSTASVALDGSGSSDADGSIVSYVWTDSTGAQVATGVSPTVDLPVGAHTLTLTVTDDDGATASDDVVITVVEE